MSYLRKIINSQLWGGTVTEEIIHLLAERNRHLSQFSILNRVQIERMKKNDFDQIDEFYKAREHLLVLVEKIEFVINEKSKSVNGIIPLEVRKNIDTLLKNKDQIIKEILDQDLQILSLVETEKAIVFSELKNLSKSRKTINAYKSGIRESKFDDDV